jgi:hypothetical protein
LAVPVVFQGGIGYELAHFEKKRATGLLLTNTRKFIRNGIRDGVQCGDVIKLTDLTHDFPMDNLDKESAFKAVLTTAVVSLVMQEQPATEHTCPETLHLDFVRIRLIQHEFYQQITMAAMLIIIGQRLSECKDPNTEMILDALTTKLTLVLPCPERRTRMMAIVKEELTQSSIMNKITRDIVCDRLVTLSVPYCKISQMMKKRFRSILTYAASGDIKRFQDRNTALTTFEDMHIPRSVYAVAVLTFNTGLKINRMMLLNMQVHADTYNTLIIEESTAEALAPIVSAK